MSDEKELIQREFPVALETTGDGRTLDLRVIPYNEKARVTDNGRDFYDEVWEPGCFDRQLDAPNRVAVLMNFEHERGIGGVVGRGTELRNATDGLEGTFRMLAGHDADKALELVNEGVLTGVSLEAEPIKTVREDGVVKRVKARLVNVALCRTPAFPGAKVMAVREAWSPAIGKLGLTPADIANMTPEQVKRLAEVAEEDEQPAEDEAAEPEAPVTEARAERSDVDEVLARIGWEPLISRAVTKKPWDGSPARFEDEEYQRSCLIDRGGDAPVKERCSLPVLEPNGDINVNALGSAAGRLGQTKAPGDLKAKAARKLVRFYNTAKMPPPASLRMMASR